MQSYHYTNNSSSANTSQQANNYNEYLQQHRSSLTNSAMGGGYDIQIPEQEEELIYKYVAQLADPTSREQALLELSKKRERFGDLAVILWYSYGVMAILVNEITTTFQYLTTERYTPQISSRICSTLALVQCLASHEETRGPLLQSNIPTLLIPFLASTQATRLFEYLRLTSLGVLGALVKTDRPEVVRYLIDAETVPICLRTMEHGSELSKTVAIFIMQKVLTDDHGLLYMCTDQKRLGHLCDTLTLLVHGLSEHNAYRQLKHIIRCYLRLSEHHVARALLRNRLPESLRDASFSEALKDDVVSKRCLAQLLANLSDNVLG